jgi:hypothetical protein
MGGRAGGEKYVVSNIMFKFAVDVHGMFKGSDYAAAKVNERERERERLRGERV